MKNFSALLVFFLLSLLSVSAQDPVDFSAGVTLYRIGATNTPGIYITTTNAVAHAGVWDQSNTNFFRMGPLQTAPRGQTVPPPRLLASKQPLTTLMLRSNQVSFLPATSWSNGIVIWTDACITTSTNAPQ